MRIRLTQKYAVIQKELDKKLNGRCAGLRRKTGARVYGGKVASGGFEVSPVGDPNKLDNLMEQFDDLGV